MVLIRTKKWKHILCKTCFLLIKGENYDVLGRRLIYAKFATCLVKRDL